MKQTRRKPDDYQAVLGLGIVLTIACLVASATTGIHYFLEGAVLVYLLFQTGVFLIYAEQVRDILKEFEEEDECKTITIPVINGHVSDIFSNLLESVKEKETTGDEEEYEELDDERL